MMVKREDVCQSQRGRRRRRETGMFKMGNSCIYGLKDRQTDIHIAI